MYEIKYLLRASFFSARTWLIGWVLIEASRYQEFARKAIWYLLIKSFVSFKHRHLYLTQANNRRNYITNEYNIILFEKRVFTLKVLNKSVDNNWCKMKQPNHPVNNSNATYLPILATCNASLIKFYQLFYLKFRLIQFVRLISINTRLS